MPPLLVADKIGRFYACSVTETARSVGGPTMGFVEGALFCWRSAWVKPGCIVENRRDLQAAEEKRSPIDCG